MPDRETPQGTLFAVAPVAGLEAVAPLPPPEDSAARRQAVDTTRSILVQAPAGAGKTSLLTQRYLALLAQVEEPEQILAITFTRAATAEMRQRIVQALERARSTPEPGADEAQGDAMPLARAALRHADALGWRLLEQPHRLDVQTIDSLCLRLAHGQPLLARLGGALEPTEDAAALYAMAARRTTALLGSPGEPELEAALGALLLRRDNNLEECERLLAGMLARRDAWLGVLPLAPGEAVDWMQVRAQLEQPFADETERVLQALQAAFTAMPNLARALLAAARYAAANLRDTDGADCDLRLLETMEGLPAAAHEYREHWRALASLLLRQDGGWRRQWTVKQGFPPPGAGPEKNERKRRKEAMKECSAALQAHPRGGAQLQLTLCQLQTLPELRYSDDQWRTLRAVFVVLRRAAAELRLVFAEANTVDFVEIAQAAETVLRDESSLRGLLESEQKRHVLIDEFQDTSRAQYRLVAELLREWREGDGRTVFVVGDPLQSIYGFRQAEVALFHETREHGLPCGDRRHPCHALQLTHNFRSHRALVEQLNTRFAELFAGSRTDSFVAAHAWPQADAADSFHLHTFFIEKDAADEAPESPGNDEAAEVVRVLKEEQKHIAAAEASGAREYRVAVLVRSRPHLAAILPALRAAGIPYRAVELEPLAEQPEIHDLLMLLRALLHPADRVAWLTVLRAPWCGLLLRDLHLVTGADDPAALRQQLPVRIAELLANESAVLSPDGRARLARTWAMLEEALRTRYSEGNSLSLAAWVERTWMALGGPACVDQTARENVEAFLRLLDGLAPSGVEVLRGDFALRLKRLCAAPDTRVSERFGVQLMTMHKAKGLGFEVVLLPGLERKTRSEGTELLAMLERTRRAADPRASAGAMAGSPEVELLLAPVGSREDGEQDRTYAWVMRQRAAREAGERKRLFYVACTRARTGLHLFATLNVSRGELRRPDERSLLGAAWTALRGEVEEQWRRHSAPGLALAAVGEMAATEPQEPAQPMLERLPSGWAPTAWAADVIPAAAASRAGRPYARGSESSQLSAASLAARARGVAMHGLLEQLSVLFAEDVSAPDIDAWRAALQALAARLLSTEAFPQNQVRTAAAELAAQALAVAATPTGRWLLSPHPGALAESSWQRWDAEGTLRTLRVDRCFAAGSEPGQAGDSCLWIVDYKTGAHPKSFAADDDRAAWLAQQKDTWRPQLETYGAVLASAAQARRPLRYALYFPELLELVSWPGEPV